MRLTATCPLSCQRWKRARLHLGHLWPLSCISGWWPLLWPKELWRQVATFRKLIAKVTADKHEEVLCRQGAIMAGGIMDAGMPLSSAHRASACLLHALRCLARFLRAAPAHAAGRCSSHAPWWPDGWTRPAVLPLLGTLLAAPRSEA